MKKFLLVFLIFALSSIASAEDYESLNQINSKNWASYFNNLIGYVYESHGCLHYSPTDAYLLYKTIPAGIPITIKKYNVREKDIFFKIETVPFLSDKTNSAKELKEHALTFKHYKTEIVVYPSLDLVFILVNNYPYAKVKTLAGPPYNFLMPYTIQKGRPIEWDFMLSTPTDPGTYSILKVADHYISSSYYKNTIVPFGAWIRKVKGIWSYQKNGRWYKLPQNVLSDLKLKTEQRQYNYYDVNVDTTGKIVAARYAGHDFGKYVVTWTRDGKNRYPEMGYAAGELLFEQIILVKDLVHLLTLEGSDDLKYCISKNANFSFYKDLYEFKKSNGKKIPKKGGAIHYIYYKLFNGLEINTSEKKQMDPRVVKAFKEFKENRLPRRRRARAESLGLYQFLRQNSLIIEKQAYWYEKIKQDWQIYKNLRKALREDFEKMGILSLFNRQNVLEGWINSRLEFKTAGLPKQAKYLTDLSFSTFFKPDEESRLFTEREQKIMREKIRKAVKGDLTALNLEIVPALNKYNFGVLLNEILGDLYKSHGCMHLSPRNAVFLYQVLPIGTQMKIYKYSEKVDKKAIESVPYLANLVNFKDDLDELKKKFSNKKDVKLAVYPYSGDWIIYLKEKPFARLRIRGGPQTKFYLLQGRIESGKPLFEDHLAYPTTPGDYIILKKAENYISNIYYDQTLIPMGGLIKWEAKKKKWIFQDKKGKWRNITRAVGVDLGQSDKEREYTYYDVVKDSDGKVVSMRWGSHPFGQYSLQSSRDRKTAWPELIHSSGDLIMEERQLINDLIKVLTAPFDELDQCISYSRNFDLYKTSYDFTQNPNRTDLIQAEERAAYKLYYGLSLSPVEEQALHKDVIVANKLIRGKKLSQSELKILIDHGIAYRRSGNVKINMEKVLGLQFDTYQYVVTIQKYAHHYKILKQNWKQLSELRKALLKDFNNFVIKDTNLFHSFMRELMLKRNQLEKLSQKDALEILNNMLDFSLI